MHPDPQHLGSLLLGVTTLLGTWYLTLRIRAHLVDKRAYASRREVEHLRSALEAFQREARTDVGCREQRLNSALAAVHDLIRKNAEHIAALIAHSDAHAQRLTELTSRVDRLNERF